MTALFPRNFPAVSPPPPLFLSAGKKYNFSLSPSRQICHLSKKKEKILHRTGQTEEKMERKKIGGKSDSKRSQYQPPVKKSPSKLEKEENEREKSFKLWKEKEVRDLLFFCEKQCFYFLRLTWLYLTPHAPASPPAFFPPRGMVSVVLVPPLPTTEQPDSSRSGPWIMPSNGCLVDTYREEIRIFFKKIYCFYSTILKGKQCFLFNLNRWCFLFERKISEHTGDPLLRNSETLTPTTLQIESDGTTYNCFFLT